MANSIPVSIASHQRHSRSRHQVTSSAVATPRIACAQSTCASVSDPSVKMRQKPLMAGSCAGHGRTALVMT